MKPPAVPTHYTVLLADIKQRIRQAQTRAVLAVNAELIRLYWEIGQMHAGVCATSCGTYRVTARH